MKHVFVETNFLVYLLRPFPTPEAQALFDRNGVDVTLHVPWCSQAEGFDLRLFVVGQRPPATIELLDELRLDLVRQRSSGELTAHEQVDEQLAVPCGRSAHETS